ncbi:hypothetical protein EDB92DRAFT_1817283 [Lactarius akahatsu]|uniref:Nucleolus and neural progenitor protein-like N-terminal domain-containing protein n=1 Tax=Lactarius akahatsu TaxID=416441 RepID=A0AAD4LI05_9AGAM|nr:hypothetical protein EDB92DRAFT_1817283 [Lactarius akahatsu]
MASSDASLTRASLDSSKHSFVDAFLKSLKLHTRKLGALLAQHATELLVLERIYHINNNQHRAALFWKRIVEARRYARRLKSCDVSSLVNGLRMSFYDQSDARSKPHKGAWSHYPPASSLNWFLERLRTCIALLDKARRSLQNSFAQTDTSSLQRPASGCVQSTGIMLTLAMRSGAFLHLVVTLTALVARLAHLSSALRHVLSVLHAESICFFDTLHPAKAKHKATPLPLAPPLDGVDAEVPSALLASTGRVVPDSDLDMSVDLGEAIARPPMFSPRPKSTLPMVLDLLLPTHSASVVPVPVVGPRQLAVATGDVPPTLPQPLALNRPSSHPAVVVKRRATAPEEPRQKKRTKAKKAQRDEIDDIFS